MCHVTETCSKAIDEFRQKTFIKKITNIFKKHIDESEFYDIIVIV